MPPAPGPPDVASIAALVDGGRVSSGFGQRPGPIDGHTGADVAAAEGTPIHAAAGGVVRRAGARGGYGNAVEIDHGNGVTTLYGHASELLVHEGEEVAKGQAIRPYGAYRPFDRPTSAFRSAPRRPSGRSRPSR